MLRINGINDDPHWGSGPVFECKLYYRAEQVLADLDRNDESNENESDDMDEDDISLTEALRQETPLDTYKEEKIEQLIRWHGENKARDKEVAEQVQIDYCNKIEAAENTGLVDEFVK